VLFAFKEYYDLRVVDLRWSRLFFGSFYLYP